MSIPAFEYQHPMDRFFLKKLQGVVGFDLLVKETSAKYLEIKDRIHLLGDGIRVTERHFPKINRILPDVCAMLGVKIPEVYVIGRAEPDAYTTGIKNPRIVVSAGLLERVSEPELAAIIAHECGHIACDHLLYHNVLTVMLTGAGLLSSVAAKIVPLVTPFLFKWYRASEFSADRAATVAMKSAEPIQGGLMKLMTGNSKYVEPLDVEEIIRQADELEEYADDNMWNKLLNASMYLFLTHPMTTFRIRELHRWEVDGGLGKVLTCGSETLQDWENETNKADILSNLGGL